MFRKTPLARAIGAVTAGSLAALPAIAVTAAEEEEEAIDEVVVVTGSRIRRDVADTPSPVTVIDREEIDLSGIENVADLLRNTTYNNFGSFRERSGSSFGQIALISLRGLGADRTAVLINGRRVPGNPFTGSAAVDLNSIPLTAIDRVEILTDSASAVYGTDALGGVVNVILRDDYEGAEIKIGTDMPEQEGADSDHVNFFFGAAGERARMLFTAEWFKRDPIFDGDRDYSRVMVTDPGDGTLPDLGVHTAGVSAGGNTAFAPGFTAASAVGDCSTDVYAGLVENPFGVPGTACGFGYADISAQTGGLDRVSTYLNTTYEWRPGHELFFENRFSRIASFGRYAPAPGFFDVPGDSPHNPFDTTAASYPTLADGTPAPFSIFHRFVGHGPRDEDTDRYEIDNVVGLEGELADGTMRYEAYARHYSYQAAEEGETYILESQVELETELGDYNLANPLSQDPLHLAALGRMAATLFRDILTDYTAAGVSLDGFGFNLPAGQIGWAVGAEVASNEYLDDYDSFREAGNILGSAGNSAAGSRSRWAGFGELSIPVLDNLEFTAAGRYDSYDDFGTAFSPQIAARYQPLDAVVLRASWGKGFKAPNLTQLYQSRSQSFNNVPDTFRCQEMGTDPCPTFQVENFTGGNPLLEAETAESFNFGIVVEPIPSLTFSIDYFNIQIEDVVASLTLGQILLLENAGTLPSGVVVRRGTGAGNVRGRLISIDNVFANLAVREITGLDLRLHYEIELAGGLLAFDVEGTKLDQYEVTPNPFDPPTDILDTNGSPDRRGAMTLRWSRDTLTLNYAWRFIGPHGGYPSHQSSDLIGVYGFRWGGEISGGVRNILNEDPAIDEVNGWDDTALLLYDVAGRVPFIRYRHTF